jgi:hypothetical protein
VQEDIPLIPTIYKQDDGWALSVDGAIILKGIKHFSTVLQCWFASFYIVSIEFPAELNNTCVFIERALMGEGKGKMSANVRKWANRLFL